MHNFTFLIKHIVGNANKFFDALSRRCLTLSKFQVKTLGFEHLEEMYSDDLEFKEEYEACLNLVLRYRSQWIEYMIQEGFFSREINYAYQNAQ
jgi:hypothetical protein